MTGDDVEEPSIDRDAIPDNETILRERRDA